MSYTPSELATRRDGWFWPSHQRRAEILAIALPIIGGMTSQNILNLVDTAMVGQLGDSALAAAGVGSFANYMSMAIILGLATGVQAIASRRVGQGRLSETAHPLNGGLLLALCFGAPLIALLAPNATAIVSMLNDDPAVVEQGGAYLGARLLAIVGVAMNFSFRGYWSAVHLTKLYMRTLIAMHSLNIFLNWVLIFGNLGAPEMGVVGAGWATTISIYFGTLLYFILGMHYSRGAGFLHGVPSWETIGTMLRLSIPASVQQLLMAGGLVALIWIVGRIGTSEVGAVHVLLTLVLVAILPAMGFGLAAASLVGHALGRGEPEDAARRGWEVATLAAVVGMGLGVVGLVALEPILDLFFKDPATRELARFPLILTCAGIWIDSFGSVLFHAHLGAGAVRRVMLISILFQWLLFLPLAWLLGPKLGLGLMAIWIAQVGYRTLQSLVFASSWRKRDWQQIEV